MVISMVSIVLFCSPEWLTGMTLRFLVSICRNESIRNDLLRIKNKRASGNSSFVLYYWVWKTGGTESRLTPESGSSPVRPATGDVPGLKGLGSYSR